ncbi:hypothetical protein IJZ97_04160, partial [bacterium]|nr:hypothetical protein [bacterium]
MDITVNSFRPNKMVTFYSKPQVRSEFKSGNFASFNNAITAQNKALISFKGYYGDPQPIKKLYWNLTGQNQIYNDQWTNENLWICGNKRWIKAYPNDLLKRSASETINSIMTLTNKNEVPSYIPSPSIRGDCWGRYANYIEINPRLIAKYENGRISDGLLQTTKIMTATPPSSDTAPNCLILSQLFPSFNGDGTTLDETLYHVNMHAGISKNLTARGLDHKMGDD